MSNLVNGEPNRWEREEPKEEETEKRLGVGSRIWYPVGYICDAGEDGAKHDVDAFSSDPGLNSVPDTSHNATIQDRPQRSPDTERSAINNREGDMIHSTHSARGNDETGSDSVAGPDTEPCFPPGETRNYAGGN